MAVALKVNGSRIAQARLAAGMSQPQLARAIGTSEKNISRWETSKNQPRIESVAAIARATGHDIDFFLTAEGEDTDEDAPLTRAEMDLYVSLRARVERQLRRAAEATA